MRTQPEPLRPDPITAAVSGMLDDADAGFTRADREMMAWTEGLLTAAAIGPERTRPDEWARAVFGNAFKAQTAVQAQASIAMLTLMYNAIVGEFLREGADYVPFFLNHAKEGEAAMLGGHWAAGFMAGMQLRSEAWESLMASREGKLSVASILALLTDAEGNSLFLKGDAGQQATDREAVLDWLGLSVHEISEYWGANTKRPEPAKIEPFRKIGRNDPCLCGSGKKYKKCCLEEDQSNL
jgi:uncharacterized protein